jgi:hypothetical protein
MNGSHKASVIAICTVSKSENKPAPIYMLKGRRRILRPRLQLVIPLSRVTLSPNGWIDQRIVIQYLSWPSAASNSLPIVLTLDSFRTHDILQVRVKPKQLGIELILFPRGQTGEHQPLDCSCFGPVRSMSRRLRNTKPTDNWSHEKATELLEIAQLHFQEQAPRNPPARQR